RRSPTRATPRACDAARPGGGQRAGAGEPVGVGVGVGVGDSSPSSPGHSVPRSTTMLITVPDGTTSFAAGSWLSTLVHMPVSGSVLMITRWVKPARRSTAIAAGSLSPTTEGTFRSAGVFDGVAVGFVGEGVG